MIRREAGRMALGGPVTLANAAQVLEEGRRHLAEGAHVVDLGEVTEMDSALLALLLVWLREAGSREQGIAFARMPESLRTLSRLYGVDGLLPLER